MKTSKISLMAALIAGVLLAYGPAARAEDTNKSPRSREGRPGRPELFNRIAEDLKLTAEQKPKVQEVMKNRFEKGRSIREDSSLSEDQKREKGKALMDETDKKMKEILTAEQYEKWQKHRHQRGPGGRGQGPRKSADNKK